MEDQQEDFAEILREGLKYIDDAIANDSNTKVFLWNTIERVLTRPNDTYEKLGNVVDKIFQPPSGRAIEVLLSAEFDMLLRDRENISTYLVKNREFYTALNQSFSFDYHASVRLYNYSPLSLLKLELIDGAANIVRIHRADKTYFDIELDSVGVSYITEFMFNLIEPPVISVTDEYRANFLEYFKDRAESALNVKP